VFAGNIIFHKCHHRHCYCRPYCCCCCCLRKYILLLLPFCAAPPAALLYGPPLNNPRKYSIIAS
jgi:hypothetical protein